MGVAEMAGSAEEGEAGFGTGTARTLGPLLGRTALQFLPYQGQASVNQGDMAGYDSGVLSRGRYGAEWIGLQIPTVCSLHDRGRAVSL